MAVDYSEQAMKPRTLAILKALVDDFVHSATPVSSQRLLESHSLGVSSATVRNEFAVLEEVGLIRSPHVSAGKIPTEEGYRFFVQQLPVSDQKQELLIQKFFEERAQAYQKAKAREHIFETLQVIADCSRNAALVVLDNEETFYLGLSHVLRSPEFVHNPGEVASMVEVLEGRERLIQLIRSLPVQTQEAKIFIGEDDLLTEIASCSLVAQRFETKFSAGILGILGPMRMNYLNNKILLESAIKHLLHPL